MLPEDTNIEPNNTERLTHSTKNIIFPLNSESQDPNYTPATSAPIQPVIGAQDQSFPSLQNLTSPSPSPSPNPAVFMPYDLTQQPSTYQQANTVPAPTTQPIITVGGSGSQVPIQSLPETSTKKSHKKKRLIVSALSLLVMGGLAAGLYFGVYMNPSFIWSESLSNAHTAYSRLINAAYTAPVTHDKGAYLTGNINISSGTLNSSVSIVGKSYNKDNTASIKIDEGLYNIDVEEKATTPPGSLTADYYVQLNGIKSISPFFGPSLAPNIASLDGRWIELDHNLIADLKQKLEQQSTGTKMILDRQQILATFESIGAVNKKYLFNTDANHAVTKIVKRDGFQTLNNQKTYEYTIGFNKNNTKTYLYALCNAVKSSPLGAYIADNSHRSADQIFNCSSFANQANTLKANNTFKAWVNLNNRLIQQIQINGPTNAADNYVALGYDYKGGNTFPFYLKGLISSGNNKNSFEVNALINIKASTASINFKANFSTSTSSATKVSGNIKVQPNNTPLNLTIPTNVVPIDQVLVKLGLGSSLQQLLGPSTSTTNPITTNVQQQSVTKKI